jgi:hypothetical protein
MLECHPTAVQAVADEHDTALRTLVAPEGFGGDWILQPLPFQPSASVSSAPVAAV